MQKYHKEEVKKEIPCKQIEYNNWLVRVKRAANYTVALGMFRSIMCHCRKCHPLKRYAGQR